MSDAGYHAGGGQRWSLEDAVSTLKDVALVPAKQRHTSVADLATTIASHAFESGIPETLLHRLVGIVVKPNCLDQSTITTIVKNLYPSKKVSSDVVAKIVCALGPGKTKPSPATQNLLLRWLILVCEDLEDPAYLSKLYSVLFDNLDMISLRRSLCHLLSIITRRQHIKPFRIRRLMELIRYTGDDEKELLGLLRVFKSYYSEIIVGETMSKRRATYLFKHPDLEWTAHMRHLQDKGSTSVDNAHDKFRVVHRGGVKRSRIEVVIPLVQTSGLPRGFSSLEELRDVKDFVKKLDKIELPNQIASALTEPLAQRYLLLVNKEQAFQRLNSWLRSFFQDEMDNIRTYDQGTSEYLEYVLDALVGFVRYTKTLPQAADEFIRNYLPFWDGYDNREAILGLMEYIPLSDFDTLAGTYFFPLESAILDNTVGSKTVLLRYYVSLMRRWGTIVRSTALQAPQPPLQELISRIELLCLAMLETPQEPGRHNSTQERSVELAVLHFYVELSKLYSFAATNVNIRMTAPLSQTIYILAFVPSLCSVSLLSATIGRYKSSFEASVVANSSEDPSSPRKRYPPAVVDQFNGYVMDICNLLWRNRALNHEDPNAKGCLIPARVTEAITEYLNDLNDLTSRRGDDAEKYRLLLASLFSFGHHVALCGLAAACFRDIETQAEAEGKALSVRLVRPVTQKALNALEKDGGVKVTWQEFRLKMLDWLDDRGSEGIGSLMRVTMKTLRKG
ncbi:hypothetical protein VTO42DRAFT_204 [Malbranchea cinnamomea]